MLLKSLKPSKKALFLIAGHGGSDPGAVGNGYKEADLTLELRDLIASKLEDKYTIYKDVKEHSLNSVITWLKSIVTPSCLLVDIHFNAAATKAATGTEILVPDAFSSFESKLATDLAVNISKVLGIKNRAVKKESQSARSRIAILNVPAENVLIEVCFISNKSDIESYQKNKEVLADTIANTIWLHYK